jgi:FkbM family methyltransferase
MALKAHLKRTLEHWPKLYAGLLRLRAYVHPTAGEPELQLLPKLCPGDETAIDVGANHGDYSAVLVGLARDVIAVEPNPAVVRVLEARLGDEIRRKRLQLVRGAFGSEAGTARLFIPDSGSALGSLDAPPIATGGKAIEVLVRRLDDLARGRRVGFIKIDVEGYEAAVLRGGMAVISESRPTLLIEIEERHRKGALEEVCGLLKPLGYRGFYLHSGRFEPVERFDSQRLQNAAALDADGANRLAGSTYINNFIFAARPDVLNVLASPAPGERG